MNPGVEAASGPPSEYDLGAIEYHTPTEFISVETGLCTTPAVHHHRAVHKPVSIEQARWGRECRLLHSAERGEAPILVQQFHSAEADLSQQVQLVRDRSR